MEPQTGTIIKPEFGQTGMATTALFLAASILPGAVYPPLRQTNPIPVRQSGSGSVEISFASALSKEQQRNEVIKKFAVELTANLTDSEPDVTAITNRRFFDMYEDF